MDWWCVKVTLQWPLSLAVSPIDNCLHIVDNGVVVKLTADGSLVVVAGRLLHCPPPPPRRHAGPGPPRGGAPALGALLRAPQHVSFAPDGRLYVVESAEGAAAARVWVVSTDGLIGAYVGGSDDDLQAPPGE